MGLGIKISTCGCETPAISPTPSGNPDPTHFEITSVRQIGHYLIAEVEYPNCTNYEGRKLMVYHGITEDDLRHQRFLDPHFCESDEHISPLARFEPTDKGRKAASAMIQCLRTLELASSPGEFKGMH